MACQLMWAAKMAHLGSNGFLVCAMTGLVGDERHLVFECSAVQPVR